jgi:hypothetical protein
MAETIAYKITATDPETGKPVVKYVNPKFARQMLVWLNEEGYNVVDKEQLTEMPEGVELDIDDDTPENAADYID